MSDRLQQFIETSKGHIQAIFGCGLNAANNSNFIENTSNQSKFFGQISSSKNILVGATGFEPATSRPPAVRATKLRHTPQSTNAIIPEIFKKSTLF